MTIKLTDLKEGDILVYAAGDHSRWRVSHDSGGDWSVAEVVEIGGGRLVHYIIQESLDDGSWILDTDSLFYKQLKDL